MSYPSLLLVAGYQRGMMKAKNFVFTNSIKIFCKNVTLIEYDVKRLSNKELYVESSYQTCGQHRSAV